MKPITLAEAKALKPGQIIYDMTLKNHDKTPARWRVNGQVQTWKRDSSRVRVPLKHGLYAYEQLHNGNLSQFSLTAT